MTLAFTSALLSKLKADTALMLKLTYLGDMPPDNQASPYVVIGAEQDTRGRILDETETRHFFTLHIWSDYKGRKEVKEIMALIRADLEQMEHTYLEEAQILIDTSDWWHGVISYYTYL
jgi:hypothetical protein